MRKVRRRRTLCGFCRTDLHLTPPPVWAPHAAHAAPAPAPALAAAAALAKSGGLGGERGEGDSLAQNDPICNTSLFTKHEKSCRTPLVYINRGHVPWMAPGWLLFPNESNSCLAVVLNRRISMLRGIFVYPEPSTSCAGHPWLT